jgi:excisionase family DNA binding protein
MNLTEEQLRERGILRSVEEMVSEAEKMVALSVASMPVGRRVADSGREFTESESEALNRGGLDVSRPSDGSQLAQTAARYAAMLASSLTVAEAAVLLGVSESRIRQRMGDRTLYSVRVGKERRLPRFQFAEGEEVPGVGRILREIPEDVYPLSVENWFTRPNPDLYLDKDEEEPVSPREWLLSGGSPDVLVPVAKEL